MPHHRQAWGRTGNTGKHGQHGQHGIAHSRAPRANTGKNPVLAQAKIVSRGNTGNTGLPVSAREISRASTRITGKGDGSMEWT